MLEDQSVEEIIHNINQRQISIKEVMEYYLDRIEKFNPDLNAIVLLKDRGDLIKEASFIRSPLSLRSTIAFKSGLNFSILSK